MSRFFRRVAGLLVLAAYLQGANAQDANPDLGYTRFDEYTVYYSVFNSTMVEPDIARLHQITRAENQVLVNVALVANEGPDGGQAAEVSGSVSNLMQQTRELKFKAIVEDNVIYYLAPLRITDEEILNFTIDVDPRGQAGPYTVKFSKKLYVDE